jgi:hypothetical protein
LNKDDSNIMHRKERETKKKLTFSSFLKRSRPQSWFLFSFLTVSPFFLLLIFFPSFGYSTSTHFARKAFHSLGLWELQQSEEKRRKRREITAKAFLNVQSTLNFFSRASYFFCFSLISSEKMFVCQSCR